MAEHEKNFQPGIVPKSQVKRSKDYQILRDQSLRVVYLCDKNQNRMVETAEFSEVLPIFMLHNHAKKLMEATADDLSKSNNPTYVAPFPFRFSECFLQHKFSPYADLYSEFFPSIKQTPRWDNNLCTKTTKIKNSDSQKNKMAAMREKFDSADFKKKIKGIQRTVNKNRQNLLAYFHGLFARDKNLLVLRLNLGYSEEEYIRQYARAFLTETSGLTPLSNKAIDASIQNARQLMPYQWDGFSPQDVVLHREELIRHLRATLKQKLRGYTWKIDYTKYKGYQYHVVIFLDATLAQAKLTYEEAIGKHWEDVITQGYGLCYSGVESKTSYRFCATGVKNQVDPDLPNDLAKIADFLTRPDLYLQLVLPDNQRTLGKGCISTKEEGKKKGVRQVKSSKTSPRKGQEPI